MDQRPCKKCRKESFSRDDDTGALVCNSCGIIQDFDNYDAQLGGIRGQQGTFIRAGTSGSGTLYSFKEKKLLEAQRQIDEFMSSLQFSASKSDEVKAMISEITDGEFGLGNWFPILIGACSYVVMRKCSRSLSMAEVAAAICCDVHELGRMITRVVRFLDLKLPEFDLVGSFEHSIRTISCFKNVSKETFRVIIEQGVFLLQCGVKWFLATGRKPLPLVVAVIFFVAKMNRVEANIEDVAKEVNAVVSTSKTRYKELLEALVKVARASLPWGLNVTSKNIMINAPFVLKYMEMKSSNSNNSEKRNNLEGSGFDMEEVVSACLSKEIEYGTYTKVDYESRYYEITNKKGRFELDDASSEKLMISYESESLPMGNAKFVDKVHSLNKKRENGRKRNICEIHASNDLWNGNSELSKKLSLDQILEKDVGMEVVPPSYLSLCLNNEKRRQKIMAAKLRINEIMNPKNDDLGKILWSKSVPDGRRKRRKPVGDSEWEDLVIETLLLHQVKEEEIEKGHYNALLDLHVFNSGLM